MSTQSHIQWTDATWNPIAGCTPVSEGCRNCYAAKEALRLAGNPHPAVSAKYAGTSVMRGVGKDRRAVFTGVVNLAPEALNDPLHWSKPRRVFVNSMSDLFHEQVPLDFIAQVFDVMAQTPHHTYQILTKRPGEMCRIVADALPKHVADCWPADSAIAMALETDWPLRNVHLGTSAEDQEALNARAGDLIETPAAVRFLSLEPLLGPITFRWARWYRYMSPGWRERGEVQNQYDGLRGIHWVIAGGESGPGARPMDVEWVGRILNECREAKVAVFVKQLGAKPQHMVPPAHDGATGFYGPLVLKNKKGGDIDEWPEDLRVREFPAGRRREWR